jgi:hypothetical protein
VSQNYYVVNAGRGRATHIMQSREPSTPDPNTLGNIAMSIVTGYGRSAKLTLCGLPATRYVDVFTPAEASCRGVP